MDRVSESLLTEFSNEHGIALLAEDKRFEHFVSFVTVGRHYGDSFDTEDVLVGDAAGIDAIAIIVNGTLITDVESMEELDSAPEFDVTFVFVQADRGSNFDAAKIGSFGFAVSDFFKEHPTLPRNAEVAAAAEIMSAVYKRSTKFKRGNPACRLYFATTGTWVGDPLLEGRRRSVVDDLSASNLFREATLTPLGAAEIQRFYRQTKNAIEREFIFEHRVTIPDVPGVTQAYLGFLPVPELMKIITDESGEMIGSLFYSNPRDWQDYNEVNSEIKGTLKSGDKSRFVLMNNGITVIARDIRPTGNKFVIEDYQIVNGCQTTHVVFGQAEKEDRTVAVPVRLIGTQDENVINAIIRATNRQTQVTEDQFFALQEFPKQLEVFFQTFPPQHRLYYERRSRQYDRLAVEKTRVITQPNVIKAFAAMFLQEAHRTTRNYSALKDRVGKEIFGKGHRMEPYYAAAFALYKLEYLFRNGKLESKYKPARFHILFAVRLLGNPAPLPRFNSREMEDYCKPILEALWDSARCDDLIGRAAEVVRTVLGGDFNRDNIRTEPTTKRVLAECQKAGESRSPASQTA
ncbi:MAG TPA: AIPR family protein [Candidatus Acidoferrales bacterium]|nr:AIPR family protein [Candidatus Acidoferrales bacterium]